MRKYVSLPYGSATILNASAENGSFSLALRSTRLALHVGALRRRDVERRRQEVDDRVEHGLHALVLERGTAEHRHELERDRALADGLDDVVRVDLVILEVQLEELVVDVRDHFEQTAVRFLGVLEHVGRDVDDFELGAFGVVVERPHQGLHLDEVDDAAEVAFARRSGAA